MNLTVPPKDQQKLTLAQFWCLPEQDTAYEFVQGKAVPKMSPKRFHSLIQATLLRVLEDLDQGHVGPEWAILLRLNGEVWVPCPDLTFISYQRLAKDWLADEACPVPPDLAVEIISPGQTFGLLTQKASDYLTAGVQRVWVVDHQARSLTVFYPDRALATYHGMQTLQDPLLPGLSLTPHHIFQRLPHPDL